MDGDNSEESGDTDGRYDVVDDDCDGHDDEAVKDESDDKLDDDDSDDKLDDNHDDFDDDDDYDYDDDTNYNNSVLEGDFCVNEDSDDADNYGDNGLVDFVNGSPDLCDPQVIWFIQTNYNCEIDLSLEVFWVTDVVLIKHYEGSRDLRHTLRSSRRPKYTKQEVAGKSSNMHRMKLVPYLTNAIEKIQLQALLQYAQAVRTAD
ncbi:unnamed protein product [Calicophoron daubneyi]|uniref:Uncharacterized protein n=1 Tax=Calicophoron daubneyi TaxID=300641 RepID=A0AAV2TNW0_CALDB